MAKTKIEQAEAEVRSTAVAFAEAVQNARRHGMAVTIPSNVDAFRAIEITATGSYGANAPADALTPVAVEGRIERFETGQDTASTAVDTVAGGKA